MARAVLAYTKNNPLPTAYNTIGRGYKDRQTTRIFIFLYGE